MTIQTIEGKVTYIDLEEGFWGIIADSGEKYVPINMPQQLKQEGAKVMVMGHVKSGTATTHMWGTPVDVVSFRTRFLST